MRVIAVVPAYNEAERIGAVVRALVARTDGVIAVDDGSIDRTSAAAAAAGARVIRHAINRGQGAALKTGTLAALDAGAEAILHIDADGQHDPDAIPALLAALDAGADVVFGSRFLGARPEGMPGSRRALLWAARQFSSIALGIPRTYTDPQSGMRAMRTSAAREIDFRQDRMAHCSEILRLVARSDLRAVEVPARVIYTEGTLKKGQKASDALRIVWQLLLGSLHR